MNVPDAPKIEPAHSGRLELAQWLTSDKNPLTLRVMANRVWYHLFGQGLVSSVDNFGHDRRRAVASGTSRLSGWPFRPRWLVREEWCGHSC